MKTLFITIVLLVCVIAGFSQQKTFLRVFGLDGSKIAKGQMLATTDSSVVLAVGKDAREIKYTAIALIKTKRSFGNTLIVASFATSATFFVTLLAGYSLSGSSKGYGYGSIGVPHSVGEILAISLMTGAIVGIATAPLVHRPRFKVNGHYREWQEVKVKLDKMLEQKKR